MDSLQRDVADSKSRLGKLDRDVTDIKSHLVSFDGDVRDIKSSIIRLEDRIVRLEDRLLPVSWKWVVGTASIVGLIVLGGLGYYVNTVIPTQIAHQVQTHVNTVVTSGQNPAAEINKRLDEIDKRLDERLNGVNDRIDKLYDRLAGSPSRLRSSLERALPKKPEEAKAGFLVTRELLGHARQKQVAIQPEELKSLALPLLDVKDGNAARGEAWETVKEFATYRTLVNKVRFGVPKPHGAPAESYFSGGEYNLGSRSEWKDAVFINCRIDLKEAQASLVLDNVRFINCDFLPLGETDAAKALVAAVLSSDGPAVSAQLLNHPVPRGKSGS